jgi:hypothetical protein
MAMTKLFITGLLLAIPLVGVLLFFFGFSFLGLWLHYIAYPVPLLLAWISVAHALRSVRTLDRAALDQLKRSRWLIAASVAMGFILDLIIGLFFHIGSLLTSDVFLAQAIPTLLSLVVLVVLQVASEFSVRRLFSKAPFREDASQPLPE